MIGDLHSVAIDSAREIMRPKFQAGRTTSRAWDLEDFRKEFRFILREAMQREIVSLQNAISNFVEDYEAGVGHVGFEAHEEGDEDGHSEASQDSCEARSEVYFD